MMMMMMIIIMCLSFMSYQNLGHADHNDNKDDHYHNHLRAQPALLSSSLSLSYQISERPGDQIATILYIYH